MMFTPCSLHSQVINSLILSWIDVSTLWKFAFSLTQCLLTLIMYTDRHEGYNVRFQIVMSTHSFHGSWMQLAITHCWVSICQFSYTYPIAHPSVQGLLEFVIKNLPWRQDIIHKFHIRFMSWLIMIDYLLKYDNYSPRPRLLLLVIRLVYNRQFDQIFWLWS